MNKTLKANEFNPRTLPNNKSYSLFADKNEANYYK